jgi:hypothetical protein
MVSYDCTSEGETLPRVLEGTRLSLAHPVHLNLRFMNSTVSCDVEIRERDASACIRRHQAFALDTVSEMLPRVKGVTCERDASACIRRHQAFALPPVWHPITWGASSCGLYGTAKIAGVSASDVTVTVAAGAYTRPLFSLTRALFMGQGVRVGVVYPVLRGYQGVFRVCRGLSCVRHGLS